MREIGLRDFGSSVCQRPSNGIDRFAVPSPCIEQSAVTINDPEGLATWSDPLLREIRMLLSPDHAPGTAECDVG